jgi:hypothetical protein
MRREKERQRESVCVCVCVCERERERERPVVVVVSHTRCDVVPITEVGSSSHTKNPSYVVCESVCVRESVRFRTHTLVYIPHKHLHVDIADGCSRLYTVEHDFQVVVRGLEHTCRDGGFFLSRVSRQTVVKGN